MKIGRAQDVRRLDAAVITDFGVDQSILMENAAIASRDAMEQCWGIQNRRVLLICGVGSNGGDGFALARQLVACEASVTVLVVGDPEKMSGATAVNYGILRQFPLDVVYLDAAPFPKLLSRLDFESYDIFVDALFGTGLSRNIEGPIALLVERLNFSDVPVLSLDIPSGVSADTGAIQGCAIQADATVCFGILKRGNLLYPGYRLGGKLFYSKICFPPTIVLDSSLSLSVNIPPKMPERLENGHKGSFGKVLIVGGSTQYRGAPVLAGHAALRTGAGYARLAVPASIVPELFAILPEAVFLPQEGGGTIGAEHLSGLIKPINDADVLVIGPGLSTDPESVRLVRELLPIIPGPVLLDGDALTALAGREELSRDREYPIILTPHPGEMARLLGSSIREVEASRVDMACEAAERYGCIVVLKGAHTIIATCDGSSWINLTGNSGMGTAGSGDVLAGVIGALVSRGMHALGASQLGVYLHGLAGDLASANLGESGVLAQDIIHHIPEAIRTYPNLRKNDACLNKIIRL